MATLEKELTLIVIIKKEGRTYELKRPIPYVIDDDIIITELDDSGNVLGSLNLSKSVILGLSKELLNQLPE
ncbi:MAG: hypothetical protein ACW964_01120 [Candidatus Hodarchaeales archaeon]|jgi:hypothetical protein